MALLFLMILGAISVIISLALFTRKKFMISRRYDMIFIAVIGISNTLTTKSPWMPINYTVIIITFILLLTMVLCFVLIGRYTIYNAKKTMVESTLTTILAGAGISYELKKNFVALIDYEDKRIRFNTMLNTVEVDFRDIVRLPFYKDVKKQLSTNIKQIEATVFPITGVILFIIGIIALALSFIWGLSWQSWHA